MKVCLQSNSFQINCGLFVNTLDIGVISTDFAGKVGIVEKYFFHRSWWRNILHSGSRDGFTILISIFRKDVGFSELRVEISLLISSIFILQIQAEFQRIFIVSEIFSNFHNMIFKELSDYYHWVKLCLPE